MMPETKYALSGDVSIAYQVIGNGPIDLILSPGASSHLEVAWEQPLYARFVERLTSFARVILFDKRGTGLSDRVTEAATLEQRTDDIRAVMDAAGSAHAALLGVSEGGAMSMLFAATYPERTTALILYGTYATPRAQSAPAELQHNDEMVRREWGGAAYVRRVLETVAPSMAADEEFNKWYAKLQRLGASPGAWLALNAMNREIDVRAVLSSIQAPTLVLHRINDVLVKIERGRFLAQQIPSAKMVELAGRDHLAYVGDQDTLIDEVEEFLTGVRDPMERNRVLATVLFTDIVASTERALELGDRKWRELLNEHNALVGKQLARFRGREIKSTGDGMLATFDGTARAIRCALATCEAVRQLGVEIRVGLHTAEIELMDHDIGGIAVHIGARIMALAGPSQVLVSSTVRDLVAGSGIRFEDRGLHVLKGVPGEWRLYAAEPL